MSEEQAKSARARSRPQRRGRQFPIAGRRSRDERGFVRALSLPGLLAVIAVALVAIALQSAGSGAGVQADAGPDNCSQNLPGPGVDHPWIDSSIDPGDSGTDEEPAEDWEHEFTYDASGNVAPLGTTVTGVCIKTGAAGGHSDPLGDGDYDVSFNPVASDSPSKCYSISGVGTSSVTIIRWFENGLGNGNPVCQAISHLDIVTDGQVDPPDGTLLVTKICVPDNDPGNFIARVTGNQVDEQEPLDCDANDTAEFELAPGDYTLSELAGDNTDLSDYDVVIDGADCNASGSVAIVSGEESSCTITNSRLPVLTVDKECAQADDGSFTLFIEDDQGGAVYSAPNQDCDGSTGPQTLEPGTYVVGETVTSGGSYITTIGAPCASDGEIELDYGDDVTCTITNDRQQDPPENGTLVVTKVCVPAGDPDPNFVVQVLDDGQSQVGTSPVDCDQDTEAQFSLPPGNYTVNELAGLNTDLGDYNVAIGGDDCTSQGAVTVEAGEESSCTITNSRLPTLTVNKACVQQDNGVFTLFIEADQGPVVSSATGQTCTGGTTGAQTLQPGNYVVGEIVTSGGSYNTTIGSPCNADTGAITLQYGDEVVCTITNDRQADPPGSGTLTITKVCVPANDPGTFTAQVLDDSQTEVRTGPLDCTQNTVAQFTLPEGAYDVNELAAGQTNLGDYTVVIGGEPGDDCDSTGLVSVIDGEDRQCTVTNTRVLGSLEVTKQCNGAGAGEFVITLLDAGLNEVASNIFDCGEAFTFEDLQPGTYSAIEGNITGLWQYSAAASTCDDGVVVESGDPAATCVVVNSGLPDLDIDKTGPVSPIAFGSGPHLYTITVTNNGTGPTTVPIVVTDTLPGGLTSVSVNENGVWDCAPESYLETVSGDTIVCETPGPLAPGASTFFTISFTAPADSCDNLTNSVTFSGDTNETRGTNESDEVTTDVDGCASDVDITKSGDAAALFGDTIEYLIEALNDGNNPAEDVVITDDLADSLDDVAAFWDDDSDPADGGTACAVNAGNAVVCSVGDVPAGETRWVLITATIDACTDIVNQATVDWTDPGDLPEDTDDVPGSNDSNVVTTVVTCSSITIAKDTDPETTGLEFDFDGSFSFTLEDGETAFFGDLEPGVFTVTESDLPDGWDLTDIDCANDDAGLDVDFDETLGTETVEINLRPGEDVSCLFNNVFTPPPPVVIVDDTPPPPPVVITGDTPPPPDDELVEEVQGVVVTPTPTLISEIEQVRRLPATGNGGPREQSASLWILAGAVATAFVVLTAIALHRHRSTN